MAAADNQSTTPDIKHENDTTISHSMEDSSITKQTSSTSTSPLDSSEHKLSACSGPSNHITLQQLQELQQQRRKQQLSCYRTIPSRGTIGRGQTNSTTITARGALSPNLYVSGTTTKKEPLVYTPVCVPGFNGNKNEIEKQPMDTIESLSIPVYKKVYGEITKCNSIGSTIGACTESESGNSSTTKEEMERREERVSIFCWWC